MCTHVCVCVLMEYMKDSVNECKYIEYGTYQTLVNGGNVVEFEADSSERCPLESSCHINVSSCIDSDIVHWIYH